MQADLNLQWAHMSEGTFSDGAVYLCSKKELAGRRDFIYNKNLNGCLWKQRTLKGTKTEDTVDPRYFKLAYLE